jgi:hypothetical protein
MLRDERLPRSGGERFKWNRCIDSRSISPSGGQVAAERSELYDEPCIRMDGWRDVGLDGNRRTGGGPAGRRD